MEVLSVSMSSQILKELPDNQYAKIMAARDSKLQVIMAI